MKHILFSLALLCSAAVATATDYYRINSFPIDGATIRDTFLIAVQYEGNTYIWDGQNGTGKNYVCLVDNTSDVISGNYQDNEVAIVHNKYHDSDKWFSLLSRGDGARESKGGYYVGGVGGGNGISFSSGQVDAQISYIEAEGIKIASEVGTGIFRFNITPNDPHVFKFYQNDKNMLYPTLYVKGKNSRYAQEAEYEDMSDDFHYARAEYWYDHTLKQQPAVKDWDFRLTAADDDNAFPQLYLMLSNTSDVSIKGTYSSTVADGQPWQVYCTNSSAKSSNYEFISDKGNQTILYLKHCSLTLTPISKDQNGVYTYLIDLKWVDQNNKQRKVYKQMPIYGMRINHTSDQVDDSWEYISLLESDEDINTALPIEASGYGIVVREGTIICQEPIEIYDISGKQVTSENGNLRAGCYIVRIGSKAAKVIVR